MQTSIITYNQIIKKLREFASDHKQIRHFGNGNIWELVEDENFDYTNYPIMFVIDNGVGHARGQMSYNFQILNLDINHDKSGEDCENDIKSDQLSIFVDLQAWLESAPDLFECKQIKVEYGNSNSVTEETDDNLTGWISDITITVPTNRSFCKIPM